MTKKKKPKEKSIKYLKLASIYLFQNYVKIFSVFFQRKPECFINLLH